MKTVYIVLFFGLLGGFVTARAQEELLEAKVTFEFPSKNVKGSISGFTSQSTINWEALEMSLFEGTVEARSLRTNNSLRDWHLRSSRYFATKTYPRIHFKSTEVTWAGDTLLVKGRLTLKGIVKPITIRFKHQGERLLGSTTIYSSDFDITIKRKREENLVKIYFDLTLDTN